MKKMLAAGLLTFVFCVNGFASPDSQNPGDWYQRAKTDLTDAEIIYKNTDHYDQVCFLAHQAVEKTLKGALISRGIQPDKTHYTAQLARRLSKQGLNLKRYHKYLTEMDRFYVPSRYPREGYTFSKEKAKSTLEIAQGLFDEVTGENNG